MMKSVEVSGRTIEEAVNNGLIQLGITREKAEIDILVEPSKGFLGIIGQKNALVKVTKIETLEDIALEILHALLKKYNISPKVDIKVINDYLQVDVTGDGLGILIGRRGDTLDALQYWLNLAVNKRVDKRIKVILDIEGYRSKRRVILEKLAKKLAIKVKQTKRKVVLEPMNPYERSIIHNALQNDLYVQTFSEGEEPYRKVVITMKK